MKRITDEQVAKALGWERIPKSARDKDNPLSGTWWREPAATGVRGLKRWTTSLDAIVAEVEARKDKNGQPLGWGVAFHPHSSGDNTERTSAWVYNGAYGATEDTAALAICASLLDYLKEKPHAD